MIQVSWIVIAISTSLSAVFAAKTRPAFAPTRYGRSISNLVGSACTVAMLSRKAKPAAGDILHTLLESDDLSMGGPG